MTLTYTHARTHTHARKYTQVPANRLAAQLQLVYFGRKADDWLRMRDCVYAACASHACTWQQLASVFVCGVCVHCCCRFATLDANNINKLRRCSRNAICVNSIRFDLLLL